MRIYYWDILLLSYVYKILRYMLGLVSTPLHPAVKEIKKIQAAVEPYMPHSHGSNCDTPKQKEVRKKYLKFAAP